MNNSKLILKKTFPVLVAALAFGAVSCTKKTEEPTQKPADAATTTTTTTTTQKVETPSMASPAAATGQLKIEEVKVGTGTEAIAGKTVKVHYTGWLTDGTKFDSSVDRGQPFEFPLGAGRVIRGWDQGVAGMKVGGKRKLTIPSELGYGAAGAGSVIPANATLVFDVELLDVK